MAETAGTIKLGVVEPGRIAQVAHLPVLAKAANIELVAISDPGEALSHGVAAKYGIGGFTSTGAMLQEDLDAVLIATPDRFHYSLGTLALKSGKHVLMEKPLAAISQEAPRARQPRRLGWVAASDRRDEAARPRTRLREGPASHDRSNPQLHPLLGVPRRGGAALGSGTAGQVCVRGDHPACLVARAAPRRLPASRA
jgi:hypothetical protein